ncbi:DeoR family transcriptional regulator [Ponticoccus litoralis]|uniref:DeoR family transcriptional regulator n=1 Tax=Ponticoccus litoralis TaxID=422297 RepID=A0AAW9SLG2_9RHOB
MKRDDRQQAIMDLLVSDGEVELDALADRFAVSRMTIHRDLDELEGGGFCARSGAGRPSPRAPVSKATSACASGRASPPRPPWPRPRWR